MGATTFLIVRAGKTANEAYTLAKKQAEIAFGNAGYTGTIAETDGFKMARVPDDVPQDVDSLVDYAYSKMDDFEKWGPCGCIEIPSCNDYIFFGWASC